MKLEGKRVILALPEQAGCICVQNPGGDETLDHFKAKLELLVGFPSDDFELLLPGNGVLDSTFNLAELSAGVLLKVQILPHLQRLCKQIQSKSDAELELNENHFPLLFWCSSNGHLSAMKGVLQQGNFTSQRTPWQRTLAHAAAAKDHVTVLKELLDLDPDLLEAKDYFGKTAADVASYYSSETALKWLKAFKRRQRHSKVISTISESESALKRRQKQKSRDPSPVYTRSEIDSMRFFTVKSSLSERPKTETSGVSTMYTSGRSSSKASKSAKFPYSHRSPFGRDSAYLSSSEESLDAAVEQTRKPSLKHRTKHVTLNQSDVTKKPPRAKTAKYYRTKYHEKPPDPLLSYSRPPHADSRYRPWKSWLVERDEAQAKEQAAANSPEAIARRTRSAVAFRDWLRRKREEQSESETESESEDNEAENKRAFERWLQSKKDWRPILTHPDYESRQKEEQKAQERRIGCYDFGSSGARGTAKSTDPNKYMRAYQTWLRRRHAFLRYLRWRGLPLPSDESLTADDIVTERKLLLCEGITYGEWLGLKRREKTVWKQGSRDGRTK